MGVGAGVLFWAGACISGQHCGSRIKMQKKTDLSILGVVSHTKDICGINLNESVSIDNCEDIIGPQLLIKHLSWYNIIEAQQIVIEVILAVVLCEAILQG